MIRLFSALLAAISILVPIGALACTIQLPPVEEMAKEVASEGVVIRGTLFQAFDASKRQPEVIRADKVFVGDPRVKNYIIYRSDIEFDMADPGP